MDRRIVIIAALMGCLALPSTAVAASPAGSSPAPAPQESAAPDLIAELGSLIDEAVTAAGDADVEAAIEAALAAGADVDLGALIEAAVEEAAVAAGQVDVGATVDAGVELTRDVIGAAEAWVIENPEIVCEGGSLGSGAAAAAVVAFVVGSPGLALRAFEEVGQVARDTCAGYVGQVE